MKYYVLSPPRYFHEYSGLEVKKDVAITKMTDQTMKGDDPMQAKVVTFQMKSGKRDEVTRLFKEFVIPGARKQGGFKGGLLLTAPKTGKGVSVAFWETESDILASETAGYYKEWVSELSKAFAAPPTREIFDVSILVDLLPE